MSDTIAVALIVTALLAGGAGGLWLARQPGGWLQASPVKRLVPLGPLFAVMVVAILAFARTTPDAMVQAVGSLAIGFFIAVNGIAILYGRPHRDEVMFPAWRRIGGWLGVAGGALMLVAAIALAPEVWRWPVAGGAAFVALFTLGIGRAEASAAA
jgi:TctA family transporter